MSLLRSLSPYLRKSAFICGLSRRRTSASSVESLCGGGFVCCSRAFAALPRCVLLRLGLGELDLASPPQSADERELIPTGVCPARIVHARSRSGIRRSASARYYFV